jgi:hypothetical protein
MSVVLQSLPVGDIAIVLYNRSQENTWHWTICIAKDETTAKKFHAKELAPGIWKFEQLTPNPSILRSLTCSAMLKIGMILTF